MEAQALHALHNPIAPAKAGRGPQEPSLGNSAPPRLRSSPRQIVQFPALLALQTPLFMSAAGSVGATEAAALPSTKLPTTLDDPFSLPFDSSAGELRCCRRRRRGLLAGLASALALPAAPLLARARGLFQMPPVRLSNRYFLVRAGESEYERLGMVNTNPVAKTSVDSGLSEEGKRQTVRSARELLRLGACEGGCWIWPSITQRSYQAAEIIAALNGVDRSHIVPEYSFLDARGLGAYEGKSLDSISEMGSWGALLHEKLTTRLQSFLL